MARDGGGETNRGIKGMIVEEETQLWSQEENACSFWEEGVADSVREAAEVGRKKAEDWPGASVWSPVVALTFMGEME